MEQLVRQGKILYVGSCNFAGWHIASAQESAKQRHFLGLVSEQSIYNLNNRSIELEVIPACRHYGLGFCPIALWMVVCWVVRSPVCKAGGATLLPNGLRNHAGQLRSLRKTVP